MTENKGDRMLALIEQRLNAYTVEETIERLHSYECHGPSVSDFFDSMESPSNKSDLYSSWELNSETLELYNRYMSAMQELTFNDVAFNEEQYSAVDENFDMYGLAA